MLWATWLDLILIAAGWAFVATVPAQLQFIPEPVIFGEWDDGRSLEQDAKPATCAFDATGEAEPSCKQAEKADRHVEDRIVGVRDYYNSDRAISLIANDETLGEREFHSSFKVGPLEEGEFMMLLAGLRSNKKPYKVFKGNGSKVVLDYGCGLGTFARLIAKTGCCQVHCVNIAEQQIREAQKLTLGGQVEYKAYDGHHLPYPSGHFDVVFFQESFSFHTPNQCEIAAEFSRVLKPLGKLVGLDWMSAVGLDEAEYRYWIGPINLAWEASTGTPEALARCLRQASFDDVEFIDTAHLGGIPRDARPKNQFIGTKGSGDDTGRSELKGKYGTLKGQLSLSSFSVSHRHTYALEAMSLAIDNNMYWEGFILAQKPEASA